MADDKMRAGLPHNMILEDRRLLTVSGVSDLDSFDEQTVVAVTDMGELIIRGTGLHISRLSTEIGELLVEGKINSLTYTDDKPSGGGFLSRVFR